MSTSSHACARSLSHTIKVPAGYRRTTNKLLGLANSLDGCRKGKMLRITATETKTIATATATTSQTSKRPKKQEPITKDHKHSGNKAATQLHSPTKQDLTNYNIYSFVGSFIQSFIHSFIHSVIQSFDSVVPCHFHFQFQFHSIPFSPTLVGPQGRSCKMGMGTGVGWGRRS